MMKKSHFTLILFLIGLVITACSKSDIENSKSFERSFSTWLSFKESSNNTYQYKVSNYSWPDHRSTTIITITNGKVTQRHYKNISTEGLENIPKEALEWVENESDLNTHKTTPAAQPLTLDEIYDLAKTNWLLKRKGSSSIFEAGNNGMISTCGFTPEGCVDDCFVGINITSIATL
ncbi:hypothetical protein GJU39_17915 [Pedobacter petrophilus]|uniref:Uncharacterized protein n=1 Tax=Pedobacter petrophilus TaxID=1908241 RepID=A0A7K0G3G9_9SPHI|nr:hypothetical protein [Pedobacter petrophilus]MRX77960.1 hypothetical protein [Pedobacter petrophilus]